MIRKIIYTILFTQFFIFGIAQDPQFSQFYSTPLYLAPSFAGATEGSRIAMNYRDQWPALPGSFVTYSFSYDQYFSQYNSGIGVFFMRDEAGGGMLSTTNIGLQYAYNVPINQFWSIRPGIHYYYYQKTVGFDRLLFSDQLLTGQTGTSIEIRPDEKVNHSDMALSILVHSDKIWFGATADHMMKINKNLGENQDYLMLKMSAFGGYKYDLPSKTRKRREESLTFVFNFKNQNNDSQLDIGTYITKEPIVFGIWYRGLPVFHDVKNHDAISLMAGFKFEGINIGYSYDFTISQLVTTTGGAHEVSLIYLFNQDLSLSKKKKITPIPCPIL